MEPVPVTYYRSENGCTYATNAEAREANERFMIAKVRKQRSDEAIKALKDGDKIEVRYRDTGGSVVWSYSATIDKGCIIPDDRSLSSHDQCLSDLHSYVTLEDGGLYV